MWCDINGIIMGEFGFITADGVYHVTVYATDENGSFKILSMRNVKVSEPLDQPGYKLPNKFQSKVQRESTNPPKIIETTTANFKPPYEFTTIRSLNVRACSSCKLPDTTPRPANALPALPFQTPAFRNPKQENNKEHHPVLTQNQNLPGSNYRTPKLLNTAERSHLNPDVVNNNTPVPELNVLPPLVPENPTNQPPQSNEPPIYNNPSPETAELPTSDISPHNINLPTQEQEPPKQFQENPHLLNSLPVNPPADPIILPPLSSVSPQININLQEPPQPQDKQLPHITVSKKQINIPGHDPIPIKDRYPNMVDGLPGGINEKDMLDLLYKFNYTLGFHGHHEKGLRNGAKIGAYFVNGRDGISRVVEYVADENGYRPKVKFINLNFDSPDWPKEDTEKSFGLKGYEFMWYPL